MRNGTTFHPDRVYTNYLSLSGRRYRYNECVPTPRTLTVADRAIVVSIPIIVLRKSQMKAAQKVSLGVFLCLSCVMAVTSIIRAGGLSLNGILDITWEIYWIWAEGCVAVIMGSAVAFRALFIQEHNRIPDERKPGHSMRQRFLHKWKRSHESTMEDGEAAGLPQIPAATLTGLKSFIRRHNRSAVATTVLDTDFGTDFATLHEPNPGEGQREIQIYRSVEWDIRSDRLSEHKPPQPFPFTVPVERELGLARGF